MNRIDRPVFFDDHASLEALALNFRLASFPHLQAYVDALQIGYDNYLERYGDAFTIANVPLPEAIEGFLRGHYSSPPQSLAHIKEIRDRSGVNTCPMCGSLHSGTLDHVLPKEEYPAFAIFGANLVPACKCNTIRGNNLFGQQAGERILHPYFDDVLAERILAAQFANLSAVPEISLTNLILPNHPFYASVQFHIKTVVIPNGIRRWLANSWSKFIRRPSSVVMELRHNPSSRGELSDILERQLDRHDDLYDSRNNWNSVFIAGLIENATLSWIYAQLTRPGRTPDTALIP